MNIKYVPLSLPFSRSFHCSGNIKLNNQERRDNKERLENIH